MDDRNKLSRYAVDANTIECFIWRMERYAASLHSVVAVWKSSRKDTQWRKGEYNVKKEEIERGRRGERKGDERKRENREREKGEKGRNREREVREKIKKQRKGEDGRKRKTQGKGEVSEKGRNREKEMIQK